MNKVILSLILAVCILGMALIMLNERLGRRAEPAPAPLAEISQPAVPDNDAGMPPLPADSDSRGFTAPPEAARQEFSLPPLPRDDAEASIPAVEPTLEQKPTPPASPAAPSQVAGREDLGAPPARVESVTPPPAEAKKDERAAQPEKVRAEKPQTAKAQIEKPKTEKPRTEKPKAEKPKTEKNAHPRERSISRFVVFARDKGATVRLTGNAPFRYKSMNLSNPERVVVDLEGQWQVTAPGVPGNPLVSNVRVGKMGDRTRLVIDLKEKPRSTRLVLTKDGNSLDVRLDQ